MTESPWARSCSKLTLLSSIVSPACAAAGGSAGAASADRAEARAAVAPEAGPAGAPVRAAGARESAAEAWAPGAAAGCPVAVSARRRRWRQGLGVQRGRGPALHRAEHGLLGLHRRGARPRGRAPRPGRRSASISRRRCWRSASCAFSCESRSASAARRSAALVRSSIWRRRSCASASERSCASRSCCRRCSAVCRSGDGRGESAAAAGGGGPRPCSASSARPRPAPAAPRPRAEAARPPRCAGRPRRGSAPPRAGFRPPCPARAVRPRPGRTRPGGSGGTPGGRRLGGAGAAVRAPRRPGSAGRAVAGGAVQRRGDLGCGGWATAVPAGPAAAERSPRSPARTAPAPARRAPRRARARPSPLPSCRAARRGRPAGLPRVRPVSSPALRGAASPLPGCACGVRRGRRAAARAPACASPWRSAAARGAAARTARLSAPGCTGRRLAAAEAQRAPGRSRGVPFPLFLAAPLGDADHKQQKQDRHHQTGDEVLDMVADEVGHDHARWSTLRPACDWAAHAAKQIKDAGCSLCSLQRQTRGRGDAQCRGRHPGVRGR